MAFLPAALRLYLTGQLVSYTGTFMQQIAMSWLVFRLTHDGWKLGLIGFLADFPAALVVLFGGVLTDRLGARRIIFITQSLAMIQAAALAWLVLTNNADFLLLAILAAILGIINGFGLPAHQVFIASITARNVDLPRALMANSIVYDLARLIGPALGGAIIASAGEGLCFLANAVSYALLLVVLAFLRVDDVPLLPRGDIWAALREGANYALQHRLICSVLIAGAVFFFAAASYQVLLPIMAAAMKDGGPNVLGLLAAAAALGSLSGAALLMMAKRTREVRHSISIGALTYGIGLMLFSQTRTLAFATPTLILLGFGVMFFMNSCNAALISATSEEKRGRVMSLFSLSLVGSVPLGSLAAGLATRGYGAPLTLLAGGAACVLAGAGFALSTSRPHTFEVRESTALPARRDESTSLD
jgi:MFS family permease